VNPALLLASAVLAIAPAAVQQGQQESRPGWPCAGRPDPSYVQVAEATGGQVFLFHPSEVGESSVLMTAGMNYPQTITRVVGSLTEGIHTFTVPMDSTVEGVLFSVSLQCLQVVEIGRPSGDALKDGETGVDVHRFEAGRIVAVDHPAAGPWRVTVSGKGLFFLVVQARSRIGLGRVEFVGRAGGGTPRAQGPLRIGRARQLEVSVTGDGHDLDFGMLTAAGDPIGPVSLAEERQEGETRTYFGQLTPRTTQFRIAVTGIDPHGYAWQRVHAPLYTTAGSE
jgi:hypothetical protein